MSAFFLAINRDESPFEKAVAEKMMSEIDIFGSDKSTLVVQGNFALGYQSLWTVPEEVNEAQPLFFSNNDSWVMFDGRVDNRDELIEKLAQDSLFSFNNDPSVKPKKEIGLTESTISTEDSTLADGFISAEGSTSADGSISDAMLIMRFYQRFGKSELASVIGPFVFVVYNVSTGELFAARDGMGGRHLVYRVTTEYILIATYEMALVAHPSVDYKFNHSRIARMVARITEDVLSSPIAGLTPLEPGEMIYLDDILKGDLSREYFYRFDGATRVVLDNDEEYAARFKVLLKQAVERRARTIGPIGTMLSGGFDSVPMSILLAQILAKKNQTVTAFSWVFDVHSSVDERLYSNDVCQRFNIEQVCINCDAVWPQFDESTYVNPIIPFCVPYVAFQQVALAQAKKQNVQVLLSGVHGDLLYGYTDSILFELMKAGRWLDFWGEAKHRFSRSENLFQWFKQYFLRPMPLVLRLLERRRLRKTVKCKWLNKDRIQDLKNESSYLEQESRKSLRPIAYELIWSGFTGDDIASGRHIDANYGVQRRYPFRDRDLCEFMMSIPSQQLEYNSVKRPIVRRAFSDEFSEELLARKTKTTFYPVVQAGIKTDKNYLKWFDDMGTNWSFYVKKCYFNDESEKNIGGDVVKWQCAYYDYWKSVCYDSVMLKLDLDNEQNK